MDKMKRGGDCMTVLNPPPPQKGSTEYFTWLRKRGSGTIFKVFPKDLLRKKKMQ